jgi:hypothetical protein
VARLRNHISTLILILLCGCATFDGRPRQVMSVKTTQAILASYSPDEAIRTLGTIPATDAAGRNTYRNRVIAAYLAAIDARYAQFLRGLSRSGKGMHVGFDGALLALTGAGAIFDKAASDLAAGATAVAGLRSSFDRELFADKALPILVSLMDSRRLAVRADITRSLSKPESAYTLEEAFSDLMRYESAGTIDGALSDAATSAGEQAKEAQYDFSKAKDLCVVDDATDAKRRALMTALESFEVAAEKAASAQEATQNRQSIQKAAQALGIAAPNTPTDKKTAFALLALIRDQIEAQCASAGVDGLRGKITNEGVKLP